MGAPEDWLGRDEPTHPTQAEQIQHLESQIMALQVLRVYHERHIVTVMALVYTQAVSVLSLCLDVEPYIKDRAPALLEDALDLVKQNAVTALELFDKTPETPFGRKGKQ